MNSREPMIVMSDSDGPRNASARRDCDSARIRPQDNEWKRQAHTSPNRHRKQFPNNNTRILFLDHQAILNTK
jgi:hypothetical protein